MSGEPSPPSYAPRSPDFSSYLDQQNPNTNNTGNLNLAEQAHPQAQVQPQPQPPPGPASRPESFSHYQPQQPELPPLTQQNQPHNQSHFPAAPLQLDTAHARSSSYSSGSAPYNSPFSSHHYHQHQHHHSHDRIHETYIPPRGSVSGRSDYPSFSSPISAAPPAHPHQQPYYPQHPDVAAHASYSPPIYSPGAYQQHFPYSDQPPYQSPSVAPGPSDPYSQNEYAMPTRRQIAMAQAQAQKQAQAEAEAQARAQAKAQYNDAPKIMSPPREPSPVPQPLPELAPEPVPKVEIDPDFQPEPEPEMQPAHDPRPPSTIEPSTVRTKFPTARIKRIMQADEEVGKVAQQTPIAVGKALEMFMVQMVTKSAEVAKDKGSKRVTAPMLKQVVEGDDQWDFLRDIVSKVELDKDGKGKAKAESESEDDSLEPKKKGRGGRKKKAV